MTWRPLNSSLDEIFSQNTLNPQPARLPVGDVLMLRQDSNLPPSMPSESKQPANGKKHRRSLYAVLAGLAIVIIAGAALLIPQISASSIELSLNYQVGEHMVYDTTNIITNQMVNTTLAIGAVTNSQSYNSTVIIDIISASSEGYTIDETITASPNLFNHPLPTITLNISKTRYYDNFMAPGGPLIFYNYSSNPTISAYLAQQSVKVGDVWKIPVNTGNASLGLTGEVTLTFAGIQDLTVPAGTFHTMQIEVTSNVLSIHSDGSSIIKIPDGMTLQLNGTSYIEQGTCRLIKADLTQITTTNSPGIGSTSTMYTEKTLVAYSKP
ncbi:MAG: hypothetical protein QM398_12465 [Thermoproteota archaeon]|jgi:hypothetical protein|nr:hypothetical protein [Thermoproteota archaeon]NLD66642.1 hypothetical protein [Thermoproteota archaeon]